MRSVDEIAGDMLAAEVELSGAMSRHGAARQRAREIGRRGHRTLAAHAQQLADAALAEAEAHGERIAALAAEYDQAARALAEGN